jgi:hypothetical protein
MVSAILGISFVLFSPFRLRAIPARPTMRGMASRPIRFGTGVLTGKPGKQLFYHSESVDVVGSVDVEEQRRIPQVAFDSLVPHHPLATVQFHRLAGYFEGYLPSRDLRHVGKGALFGRSQVDGPGGMANQRPGRLDADGHVSQAGCHHRC